MQKLLREFVTQVLNEKNRSEGEHKFNFNDFRAIDDPHMMYGYAANSLKQLGEGSSRTVFLLSSGKVLKMINIEAPDKGRSQNEAELKMFQNLKTKNIVSKIFDHDIDFNWLISELVRPITNEEEFASLLNLPDELNFNDMMVLAMDHPDEFKKILKEENVDLSNEAIDFLEGVVELIYTHDAIPADVEVLEHWGKTNDSRVVLLDYGYTTEVASKHYRHHKDAEFWAEYDKEQAAQMSNATTNKR